MDLTDRGGPSGLRTCGLISLVALIASLIGPVSAGDGIAIGIAIDIVRVDSFFVPSNGTAAGPATTPVENSTNFVYSDNAGSNDGNSGTWTILKQYVAQNETVRVIPGTPMTLVPDEGVKGQLLDFSSLCTAPSNISFPSPLGFPYIPVIYHIDDAHLNTYTSHTSQTCTMERKLELLRQFIALGAGVPTNNENSSSGISAAIFVSPNVPTTNGSGHTTLYLPAALSAQWASIGIPGWIIEERSGLALIDLVSRNTRIPSSSTRQKRHFHPSISLHSRGDDTYLVLATLFGPNSPIYSLSGGGGNYNPYKQPFLISLVVVLVILVLGLAWFLWRGARRGVGWLKAGVVWNHR